MLVITNLFCQKLNFFLLPSSNNYSKENAGISRKNALTTFFFFFFSVSCYQPNPSFCWNGVRKEPCMLLEPDCTQTPRLPGRAVQPHCPNPASWFLEGNRGDPFPLLYTSFHILGPFKSAPRASFPKSCQPTMQKTPAWDSSPYPPKYACS